MKHLLRYRRRLVQRGSVLAKAYAAKHHQKRETEMQIFDEAMKKAAQQKKKKGRGAERSYREQMIDKEINEEMVQKTNIVRRTSTLPTLQPHSEEVKARVADVKEKRRKSSLAATREQLQALAQGDGNELSEEAKKAIKDAADIASAEQEYQLQRDQLKEKKQTERTAEEAAEIDLAERGGV